MRTKRSFNFPLRTQSPNLPEGFAQHLDIFHHLTNFDLKDKYMNLENSFCVIILLTSRPKFMLTLANAKNFETLRTGKTFAISLKYCNKQDAKAVKIENQLNSSSISN